MIYRQKTWGAYGNQDTPTPNLDRLSDEGIRFETCWATPICGPSRAQLMTGRYGFRTGWFHNMLKRRDPLSEYNLTLGELFSGAAYRTAVVGKWQMPGTQEAYGYDDYFMWLGNHQLVRELKDQFDGPVEEEGDWIPGRPARYWHPALVHNGKLVDTGPEDYGPQMMLEFIKGYMTEHANESFFIYYPMLLPHMSWDFENKRYGYLPAPEIGADGKLTGRKTDTTLVGNVAYMDYMVGQIVEQAEALGIADNTVIIFTTDNGSNRYGKGSPGAHQERGPRVPMIIYGKNIVAPQGASMNLVQFADILPTVAELAGIELPEWYVLDGISFAPLLRGEAFQGRDWLFSYIGEQRMLRTDNYLLDGNGQLWFCGNNRDEQGYVNVTESDAPEVQAVREKFARILDKLPGPDPEWEATKKYREWKAAGGYNN